MLLSLFMPFMPFRLLFMPLFMPFMLRKADNDFPARALFAHDVTGAPPPGHSLRCTRLRPIPNLADRGDRFDLHAAIPANLVEEPAERFGFGERLCATHRELKYLVNHSMPLKNLSFCGSSPDSPIARTANSRCGADATRGRPKTRNSNSQPTSLSIATVITPPCIGAGLLLPSPAARSPNIRTPSPTAG